MAFALAHLLVDPALLAPVERALEQTALAHGRSTIPIDRFVRLMVIKQRLGWGYETLVREVSDSLHLRRFCRIALTERVPGESTVRKLVRRLGAEVVEEICRAVITKATTGERRCARHGSFPVVEADVRYPSDRGLAAAQTAVLGARGSGRRRSGWPAAPRVQKRSRAIQRRLRRLNRTLAARTGQGNPTALRLTGEAGRLVERSVSQARRVADACVSARGATARRPSSLRLAGSTSSPD